MTENHNDSRFRRQLRRVRGWRRNFLVPGETTRSAPDPPQLSTQNATSSHNNSWVFLSGMRHANPLRSNPPNATSHALSTAATEAGPSNTQDLGLPTSLARTDGLDSGASAPPSTSTPPSAPPSPPSRRTSPIPVRLGTPLANGPLSDSDRRRAGVRLVEWRFRLIMILHDTPAGSRYHSLSDAIYSRVSTLGAIQSQLNLPNRIQHVRNPMLARPWRYANYYPTGSLARSMQRRRVGNRNRRLDSNVVLRSLQLYHVRVVTDRLERASLNSRESANDDDDDDDDEDDEDSIWFSSDDEEDDDDDDDNTVWVLDDDGDVIMSNTDQHVVLPPRVPIINPHLINPETIQYFQFFINWSDDDDDDDYYDDQELFHQVVSTTPLILIPFIPDNNHPPVDPNPEGSS